MKIALFTFEFFPSIGGVSRHLTNICKAFHKTDHYLYVFNQAYKGKKIFNVLEKKNYSLKNIILSFKNKLFLYYFILFMWRIVRDNRVSFSQRLKILIYFLLKPEYLVRTIDNIKKVYPYFKKIDFDLILGGTCGSNILNLIYALSILFKKKIIAFAHGNEFLTHSIFSVKACFLKRLERIILSNHQMKYLIKQIHNLREEQLQVIPFGLTIKDYELSLTREEIRDNFNIPKDDFIILSVGRHVPRKNFDLVIEVVKEIKEINPEFNLKYYLIGSGPETPRLKKLARDLKVENQVFFLGAIDENMKNKFYKIADVFVMPSIKKKESVEGFGLVFLEANLFKVPVIGASSGGIKEAIIDNKTGFLIEPNDKNGLIEKITFLYNNNEKKIEMGEYGHKRVITSFNWEVLIQKYIELFNELIEIKEK